MRNRTQVLLLAAFIALAGAGLFLYKALVIGLPLQPGAETDVWTLEARIGFRGGQGPVKATLRIPDDPPGFGILNENFISRGYGLTTVDTEPGREAQWAIRRARGEQALYYRAVIYRDAMAQGNGQVPAFPEIPELDEPYATALDEIVTVARAHSADISTFTTAVLTRLIEPTPDEYIQLFVDRGATGLDRALAAQTLLSGARIPSRIANGVHLKDEARLAPVDRWLEVHNGTEWLFFDPDSAQQYRPDDLLVWWYGTAPLVNVDGGRNVETALSVRRNVIDSVEVAERRAMDHGSNAYKFSLMSLPLRTQSVFSVLLLVPVGAFVLVLMRNVIGVPTFGTFTPVLIALAFRETHLLNGMILFSFVVALGLLVRFYLERLRLLLVPRLASVLIVVVLMLVSIGVLSQRLGLETGLSVALFPMVILTMVIERMSVVWEERGAGAAVSEGAGSLVVAVSAYLVMSIREVEHMVFVFPELLLVLLAMTLVLGRYTGYRLSELFRFREIGTGTG